MYMDCTLVNDVPVEHIIFGLRAAFWVILPLVSSGLEHATILICYGQLHLPEHAMDFASFVS